MTVFRAILILSILITATTCRVDAQRRKLNLMNAVYGELFLITPDQSLYKPAVSYARLFSPRNTLSARVGIMPNLKSKILIFPITVQGYTPGGKRHHVEYGGGIMPSVDYFNAEELIYSFYPVLIGGYRYQKDTGLIFRATANIVIHKSVYLNPSVSIGYLF